MSEPGVRRYLQWYDKASEWAVGSEDLKGIDLQALQQLFGVQQNDPMYDCWEVNEEHLPRIQECVSHAINLKQYDYFIEACANGECDRS